MGNACGRCHSPLHWESETLRTRPSSPPPLPPPPPPLSQPHPHIEGGDVITSSTTAETTMDIVVDVDTTATTTGRSPVQEQPSLVMLHATFSQHDAASSSPAGLLQRHLSTTQSSLASSSNTKVGSRAVRFSPNPLSFRSVVMDNFRPMPPSVCPPTPPEAPLNLMGWQPSSLHDANNIIHHSDTIRGQEGDEYAMIKKEHQELLLLRISNPTWSSSCDQQVTDMMTTAAYAPPPPAVLPPAIVECDNGGGCYPTTEPGDIPLVISVRGSVSSSSSSSVSAASRSASMKQQHQQQPQLLPPPHAVRRSSLTNSKNPVSPSSCQHLSPTNRSPSKPHHSPTRLDIRSPAKPRIPSLCVGGGGGSGEGGDESPVDINNCNNKSKGCSPLESHHHHHHNHLQHVSVDGVAPLQLDLLHNQDSPNFSCGGGFIAFSEVGGGGNGSQRESFLLVPSDDPAYAPSSLTSETMLQQPDPPLVQQDSMKSTVSWVTSTTFHSTASGSPLLPPGRRPSGFDAFGSNAVSRRTSRNSSIQSIGGGGGGTVSPSHPSSVRRIQVPSLVLTTTSTTATTATSPNAQIA